MNPKTLIVAVALAFCSLLCFLALVGRDAQAACGKLVQGECSASSKLPFNWTTSEQSYPFITYDGSEVCAKILNLGSLPNTTEANVAHGVSNMGILLDMAGVAVSGTNNLPIPYAHATSIAANIYVWRNNTNIVVGTGANRTGYTGYLRMLYTKSSGSCGS